MKILIEESVLRQALNYLETAAFRDSDRDESITALRSALDAAEKADPVAITQQLVCDIIDEANRTFSKHQYGIRGQMVTVWDDKEAHIAAAAIKLTYPALRSALDAAEKVEPVAWIDISGRCGGHRGEYDWKCTKCGKVDWFASYTDPNKERVQCSCHTAPTNTDSELRAAAQAVVEKWDNRNEMWDCIDRLREALK